jgi:hypothetical protein
MVLGLMANERTPVRHRAGWRSATTVTESAAEPLQVPAGSIVAAPLAAPPRRHNRSG